MIHQLSIAQWKSFDAAHPAPTFFARPAWSLALASAFPHLRPTPVHVGLDDGGVLVPLMQVSGGRLGWKAFVGMPLGSYTCALRMDGSIASPQEFARALAVLGRSCDALTVTPWPLADWQHPAAWTARRHETSVIDLRDGAEGALRAMTGVSRRMAGQARRNGVECAPCGSPALAITTYHSILQEASRRWGLRKPTLPKELLEALVTHGGEDVEIWLAHCDGHPIAGGVVLYGGDELFFYSAAMKDAFARLRPSNALNVALIEAAVSRKKRWYNLGASEGLPGVERFKRGLGARIVPYHELQRDRFAFSVYSRLGSSLRRRATRRAALPAEVADGAREPA
ncbi:MAG: GNAT family N-acetyltransferase [Candidatus Baltobacteraceae bacterium]